MSWYLLHHGIKGQKWGVKNGPPYPLNKGVAKNRRNDIIVNAINTGKVSLKINPEKQMRHTKSHHLEGRSYLYGDLEYAEELVNKFYGTGELSIDSKGNWRSREKISLTI